MAEAGYKENRLSVPHTESEDLHKLQPHGILYEEEEDCWKVLDDSRRMCLLVSCPSLRGGVADLVRVLAVER